jgi:hypothetical protein
MLHLFLILEYAGNNRVVTWPRELREMVNRTLNNHRTVFTHGDLQPKKYILLIGICPAGTFWLQISMGKDSSMVVKGAIDHLSQ